MVYITACAVIALIMQMASLNVAHLFLERNKECPINNAMKVVRLTVAFLCILTVLLAWKNATFPQMMFFIICCFFLSLFIFLDSASYCLPALFTVPFFLVGFGFRFWFQQQSMQEAVVVSVFLFLGLSFMRVVCNRQRGNEIFGMGDVYLIAGLGMWLSSPYVFWVVGIAAFLGMVFIKFTHRQVIPFAPFLCVITALMLFVPGVNFL
ncbi:prepilin peptidase [Pantoea agglomerans]|uniref:prepilin peptidase n=1 Tax=Enterobacter agglomerans TaxID=549 RepID=UPI002413AA89|nr:prepilin peptidase [Pantoea agglomerans]